MVNGVELTIGEMLEDLRRKKGLTLEEAGEKACLSKTTISNYENNRTSPTYENLKALLEAYETTLLEFWGITEDELKSDMATFRRYGLSEYFFSELLLSRGMEKQGNTASCLNMMFQCPMAASALFRALNRYFNPASHEQVNELLGAHYSGSSKRVLLEPVAYELGKIYDESNPNADKAEDTTMQYPRTAEEERETQKALLETKEILAEMIDEDKKKRK